MAYRKVDPKVWDDEKIAPLDAMTKLVWIYLLTGPHTTSLPGLFVLRTVVIADSLGISIDDVERCLSALERIGRIRRDVGRRIIQIPNAPRHNEAENANVVRSWFRRWSDIPKCQLRDDHVVSLLDGILRDPARRAWAATFGKLDLVPIQLSIPLENGGGSPRPDAFRKLSDISRKASPATAPVQDLDPPPDQDLDPARAREAPPASEPAPSAPSAAPAARELIRQVWGEEYQARYRAEYAPARADAQRFDAVLADAEEAVAARAEVDQRPARELLELLLRHWFRGYLRDDGRPGFSLVERRHALAWFSPKDVPKYGLPWAKARGAPSRASPAILLPERERKRQAARELELERGEASA